MSCDSRFWKDSYLRTCWITQEEMEPTIQATDVAHWVCGDLDHALNFFSIFYWENHCVRLLKRTFIKRS